MSYHYDRLGAPAPFDTDHAFVTSPVLSPFALAIIRLILAVYTLFTAIFVLVWQGVKLKTADSYFSYFTELSYIGLCAYFWAAGVQTIAYALSHGKYPLQRWSRFLQFLHVLLFSTITTFPILVTIVYWALLASSATFANSFESYSNISMHALNSVFALFEILITHAGPAPWLHIPFLVVLLVGYLGVAYITHATQGFYTYSFLDPQKQHAKLAGYIIGIALAAVVIFSLTRSLCILRERLVWRAVHRRNARDGASIHSERTDEWETVERPGSRLV